MNKYSDIKNIWFDWGRVLIGLDFKHFEKLFAAWGLPDMRSRLPQGLFFDYEKGMITTAEFRNRLRQEYALAVSDEDIDHAWNSLLTGIPPEKLEVVEAIHHRYSTALLSNTNELHWKYGSTRWFCKDGKTWEDYFDHIFLSYEMQLTKPDIAIFEKAIRESGVRPEETLFIDDLKPNCEAARRAGLQVIHYEEGTDLSHLLTEFLQA